MKSHAQFVVIAGGVVDPAAIQTRSPGVCRCVEGAPGSVNKRQSPCEDPPPAVGWNRGTPARHRSRCACFLHLPACHPTLL